MRKPKSSDYDTVNTESIVRYINEYGGKINAILTADNMTEKLEKRGRPQLKAIAAELETACKRLEYLNY